MSATVRPAGISRSTSSSDGPLRVVAEGDVLEHDVARARARAARASGASATSSGSSRISKIRSPAAIARCACPIHMPSIRSGMTSIASRRLKAEERAERQRAGDDHPTRGEQHERLRDERQEREERHVERALPVGGERLRRRRCSPRPSKRSARRSSCANDLTTWTPVIDSSATVATSASVCWTSRSTGCETRL